MTTVKTKLRPSTVADRPGSIIFLVTRHRVVRQIATGYKVFPHEWDTEGMTVLFPPGCRESRYAYLSTLDGALREDTRRLRGVVLRLGRTGEPYTADDVVERFLAPVVDRCFLSFARDLVRQLRQAGKGCTADTYTTAANSFARFRQERDISLDDVDSSLMTAYESYLKSIGVCPNSISFYMRNLRAIYNRAVEKELTVQRYPFRHVYTGIDKTVKRAVSLKVIRQIRDLDLALRPDMDFAVTFSCFPFTPAVCRSSTWHSSRRKICKTAFCPTVGIRPINCCLSSGRCPCKRLSTSTTPLECPTWLPIITDNGKDGRRQYKTQAHRVNRNLKKIGRQLGLAVPLTTYVARHGWASIARSKNIPLATISEAMGHDSENTTRIYLASLDTSVVDKANSLILQSL